MEKDFRIWTPLKLNLNNTDTPRLYFHDREIWHCHLGENIGFEQDGHGSDFLRPVVIIRKFNNEIFWGIPLTRTLKKSPFYFTFKMEIAQGNKIAAESSTAVLSQIRLIDAKRLRRISGYVSEKDFQNLKTKIKALLP